MNLNVKVISRILGAIMIIIGIGMIPALLTSRYYEEIEVVRAFWICLIPLIAAGSAIVYFVRPSRIHLTLRDGYLTVSLCWILASLFGSFPYMVSGVVPSFIDAFFESVSGFTTTGCTVLHVEVIPKGLTMWKAIMHWLGGMGILVFAISILPMLGIGGQKIVKAEAPGPTLDKMATRISDSAKILYITYIIFAVLEFLLLSFSSMGIYDALINTFGCISTSGLTSHPGGIAYYDNLYGEVVMCVFMVLASINFVLYHHAIHKRWREFFANAELRTFLWILLFSVVTVSCILYISGVYDTLGDAFRYGGFQVIAFATTSGYTIADYTVWPAFCKMLLFALMFIGGCAASTCGSAKVIRIMVVMKLIIRGITMRIHPHAVVAVKLGGRPMQSQLVSNITGFMLVYFSVFLLSSLVLSLEGLDMITTMSTAASMLSNTGCSLGIMGAESNFSMFSEPLRLYLSILMIVGRLEIFTIIILLSPKFWNPDK